ncbi:MAG: Ig domain-containing protein [Fibrobacterales bacterium]
MKIIICVLLILQSFVFSQNGFDKSDVLSHFGILRLKSKKTAQVFASRLRATGEPLFLIRDFRKGVQQKDIIRFKDKVILIDAKIWETMKTDKILQQLAKIPVLHLQAKSESGVWKSRGGSVTSKQEQKGYRLGGELLNILESYFTYTPNALEMVLRFENDQMTLLAPKELMKAIDFTKVIARNPDGKPQIISLPPSKRIFKDQKIKWQVWAINPGNPQSELTYSFKGPLPKGLTWNKKSHTLSGTPTVSGKYSGKVTVKNSAKKSDVLSFTLIVRKNLPPIIANTPAGEVANNQPWSFTPVLADPDHPAEELSVAVRNLPQGMVFNKKSRTFSWSKKSIDSIPHERVEFEMKVTDPLGEKDIRQFKLKILSPKRALEAKGVSLNLPLDTLMQGRKYSWPDSLWLGQRITMQSISGSDTTHYSIDNSSGEGKLYIEPRNPGLCTLKTKFTIDGSSFETTKLLVVLKNNPPQFLSSLSARVFTQDQVVSYQPAVTDQENDPIVRMEALDGTGTPLLWNGTYIPLNTEKIGRHVYEFSAEDAGGQTGRQRISYEVIPKDRKWDGVDVSSKYLANRIPLHVAYRNGSSRFGLYVPDIAALDVKKLYNKSAPFVTAEANLLGEQNAAQGTFLNIGAGITFRYLKPGLITGGLMIHTSGKYTNRDGAPWVFEYNLQFFAKHAYVLTDTAGFGEVDSVQTIIAQYAQCNESYKEDLDELDNDNAARGRVLECIDSVNTLTDEINTTNIIPENLDMSINEFKDETNMNLLLQIETWFPIKYGFWFGPTFWKDAIIFNGALSETRYGLGVRHSKTFDLGPFDLEYIASVRAGWSGDGEPVIIFGDIQLHFGR